MIRVDWTAQPLGKVADAVIAQGLGVSRQRVSRARRVRAIKRADVSIQTGQLLREITYAHIGTRRLKPFREVYFDVINDYGSVTERSVYRALADLIADHKIACVVPPPMNGRRRRRYGRRNELPAGGYVRFDSPLLWDQDGFSTLVDTFDVSF